MFFPWSCDEPLSIKWNTASSHHFIPSLNTPRETRGGPDGRYYRVTPATSWNIGSSMFLAIFWCDLYFISIWYVGIFVTAPKVASFNSLYSFSEENRRDSREPPIVLQIGPLVLVQISLKKGSMNSGCPAPQRALSFVICYYPLEWSNMACRRNPHWVRLFCQQKTANDFHYLSFLEDFRYFPWSSYKFPSMQTRSSLPWPWLSERIFPRTRP